ncbi:MULTISPECIES: asparagine synthase (glutamine-hydrolyzing) [unclassified Bradyrhizobium]
MCGIVGLIQSNSIDIRHVVGMAELISHRGPDDEGYVVFPERGPLCLAGDDTAVFDGMDSLPYRPTIHQRDWLGSGERSFVALGHRRLSIVDLSPLGHQPMSYMDRYWIVYNGEVYNYIELREQLQQDGYTFRSGTDTEVLLAAYDKWGVQLFDRCNGMWSLALYDRQTKKLLLARDRFGIKPLYYLVGEGGDSLAFASEIKAFAALPTWRREIGAQPAFDFLAWGLQDHSEETLFKGVYQIPPGHYAVVQLDTSGRLVEALEPKLKITRWYDLSSKIRSVPLEFKDAAQHLRELLLDAVRLRMRADVPLGSCLSGGLDSSSVVCLVRGLLDSIGNTQPQRTFSSCSEFSSIDERDYISEVTRGTNIQETHVFPTGEELFDRIDDLVWTQDEPFGSGSIFAQWSIFRAVHEQDVVVMLDGQGADEHLAGYHGFIGARLSGLLRKGSLSEFSAELQSVRALHGYGPNKFLQYFLANLMPSSIRPLGALGGMTQMRRDWIDVHALGAVDRDPMVALGARAKSVRELSLAQLSGANLQMLLHWEDRNSMAHSIEARVPFLDYRLVEFVLSLPDAFKLERGLTKRVLREAMRGLVPERILTRHDKKGFLTAEEYWMKGKQARQVSDRIDEAIKWSGGIIKPAMREVLSNVLAGKAPFSYHVWRVVCFGAWLKKFQIRL